MQNYTDSDAHFMGRAITLAKKAVGWTNPNPMVGCVIVKNSKIIAEGYHKRVGGPHAEIEALRSTKRSVKGATMYVSLEPCSHFGRTPPCTSAIIDTGIKHVVCSTIDCNQKVGGQGVELLRKAGITVSIGCREEETRKLNEAFFTFHGKKRPFVAIKFASSLDGKLATHAGDSKWITNDAARQYSRKLRGKYQAILIGINTVLADNPHLGTRDPKRKDPLRIILDSTLRIPLNATVLRDSNVLIATTTRAPRTKKQLLERRDISMVAFDSPQVPVDQLLAELYKREIISVFVEGGGKVLGSFVDAKLIDRVYAFYAPIVLGGKNAKTIGGRGAGSVKSALRLQDTSIKHFSDNFVVIGSPQ